ncbi:MAG: TadE/TadG family type IV pilus assembly protein [Roseovarius sp.]
MSSKIRTIRAMVSAARMRKMQRFGEDEDGAVVAFTLFMLVMMLIAGGVAVDVMRHEMERARLQNTLDTAVLAAAGAPFGTEPKAIVEDFFAKAEMSQYLNEIDDVGEDGEPDIVQTLNTSKVSASANMAMDTYLMKLVGVDSLSAGAASSAERRVPKLEVSMVLDVSGSMNSDRKLINLKDAGKKFVTTILNSSSEGDAVVSVVPFSWDVSAGEHVLDALNVNKLQDYSSCLQFDDDAFKSAAINPNEEQLQLIYTSQYDNGLDRLNSEWRTCYNEPSAEMLPYSISETALHNKIDALVGDGNTSGNMGMKWGAALLDPSFQTVKTALNGITDSSNNKLVSDLVGVVPAQYNESETLKVIVMMGDGQNTYSNQFPENSMFRGPNSFLHRVVRTVEIFEYAYKNGNSSVRYYSEWYCGRRNWTCEYRSEDREDYYLYDPRYNDYKNLGASRDEWLSASEFANLSNTLDGFVSSTAESWEKAWGKMSPNFLSRENGYNVAENEFQSYTNRVQGSEKDAQMQDICTATKNRGVVVYTIGFEVPQNGTAERELKKCASSEAHYFRAQGINITDAFSSIASNVVNLRLTQ